MPDATPPRFEPPGHGHWALDRSHYPGGTTPISQWLLRTAELGFKRVFEELGIPAHTLQFRFVNGFMYSRLLPLIGPENKPKALPPAFVLKIATRVHPGFRQRNKTAQKALQERPWLKVVDRWEREIRPRLVAANKTFAAADLATMSDDDLARHIEALLEHCREQFELHFWLHGYDLGPIAFYLVEANEHGIAPGDAVRALAGASPTTAVPFKAMAELRRLVTVGGARPQSLSEVRATSSQATELLDAYLSDHGQHLATGYDLDGPTLSELPGVVLGSILDAADRPDTAGSADDGAAIGRVLAQQVPVERRAAFEQALSDARAVMDVRDDNGPNTIEWPVGLLRLAMNELARRALARDDLIEGEHIFDLEPSEVGPFCRGQASVSAQVLATRHETRLRLRDIDPPATLGPIEAAPPLSVLPAALQRCVAGVEMAIAQMGMDGTAAGVDQLSGVGVGQHSYQGPVRIARTAEEAITSMEPGDVLVVRATSPAFNAVLAIAGAVVTADGGPLSHAAVLARELGIPAVIGAKGALGLANGAQVEVDPVLGRVRLVAT